MIKALALPAALLGGMACGGAAAAGLCEGQVAAALDALPPVFETVDPGRMTQGPEECRLEGLTLERPEEIRIAFGTVTWRLEGTPQMLPGQSGRLSLRLAIDGARVIPQVRDAWTGYMIEQLNRRKRIDARLALDWDRRAGVLDLKNAAIRLPDESGITLSLRLDGLDAQAAARFDPSRVRVLATTAVLDNHGFFDGLILGKIVSTFRGGAGRPETVIATAKARLKAMVESLPETVFPPASRDALGRLIDDGPAPWGRLSVSLTGGEGVLLERLLDTGLGVVAAEPPGTLLSGATVSVAWAPSE